MIRVLLVSAEAIPFRGGVAEVVHGLAGSLNEIVGIEARVLTRSDLAAAVPADLPYRVLAYPFRDRTGLGTEMISLLTRLASATLRSDVILALDFISQRALSLVPPALLSRRQWWLYCHGSDVLNHATSGRVARRRRLFRSATGVMTNSRYTEQLVVQRFAPRRTAVVYPAIRESLFASPSDPARSRRLRGSDPSPWLVSVGRLDPRKGQETLLRAAALGRDAGAPVNVALVGDGPDRDRLQQLSVRLELGDRIRFVGTVSDADKIAWLDAADLIAQPSLRHGNMVEGLGLAMAEGGARGRVVVSTRHGGIPEVIRDGETGVLLPEDAGPATWQRRIQELLSDPVVLESMGERARTWVAERFRWRLAAEAVARLIVPAS